MPTTFGLPKRKTPTKTALRELGQGSAVHAIVVLAVMACFLAGVAGVLASLRFLDESIKMFAASLFLVAASGLLAVRVFPEVVKKIGITFWLIMLLMSLALGYFFSSWQWILVRIVQ